SCGHPSLVRGVTGNLVKLHPRQNAHGNADLAAFVNRPLQANIFPLLGDSDPFEVASARLKRFRNRIDSVENVHASSLQRASPLLVWRRGFALSRRGKAPLPHGTTEPRLV